MSLNVREVLNEYSITYEAQGERLRVLCPFHDDHNPSGEFRLDGRFKCYSCQRHSSIYGYLKQKLGKSVYFEINNKFVENLDKVINPETIENAHREISKPQSKPLLEALYRRGITDRDIDDHRIGVIKDRISIPIRNNRRYFVNLRLYRPGATSKKFTNFPRFGRPPRLFPIEQLEYDTLLLCGGEIKAIAAARRLNSFGIGAISCTAGEGNIPSELRGAFEGKYLYICNDIDEAGRRASAKLAHEFEHVATEVYVVELPLDIEKFPHGDINDFIAEGGDLHQLIKDTKLYEYKLEVPYAEEEDAELVSLMQATSAKSAGKRLKVKAVVSTMDTSPYSIPKKVEVKCNRDASVCEFCPVSKLRVEEQILDIPAESPAIIKMVGETDRVVNTAVKQGVGIPEGCKKCSFNILEHYNVEEARVSEAIDLNAQRMERSMQSAFCIGPDLQLNSCYMMTGRMFPHPKNQQATLLISNYEATESALDTYVCKDTEKLKVFQPKEWSVEGLKEKLEEIYTDLEANVTYIYERRDLHTLVDMAYHSALRVEVEGKLERGWVEVIIVGDTSCGKTWVTQNLMAHYSLGELVDCKTATAAGLLGGQEQFNKTRWFITWGKLPSNDRGLVILEELGGMPKQTFGKLTEVRSSGIAQITGIAKGDQRTPSRVRLIANSNPVSEDMTVEDYNYGLDILRELFAPQDLRRFDAAIIVAKNELPVETLQQYRPIIEHKYTSSLCRELVLWCWTRQKAIFEDDTYLFNACKPLFEKFSSKVPIVDNSTMKLKVARLAAGLAGRTYSFKDDYIFVRKCHLDYTVKLLDEIYSKESFGYEAFSDLQREAEKLVSPEAIKNMIRSKINNPEDFVDHVLWSNEIDRYFLQDLLGVPPDTAGEIMSFFIRQRALKHVKRNTYRKTKEFIALLKKMQKEKPETPEFLKGEF